MGNVFLHSREFEPYISCEDIEAAVEVVAVALCHDIKPSTTPPLFLVTLSGAFVFAAELAKRLTIGEVEFAFVKCSSYVGTCSNKNLTMSLEPTIDVAGRQVIVLEDIVDTGLTYEFLKQYLTQKGALDVKIATLCVKKEVFKNKYPLDYVGLEVEDKFIVGYGLDYDQLGRNLNGLYTLKR